VTRTSRQVYRHADLHRLIEPQVIAVVGASTRVGSFGQRTLANLRRYTGRTYAVNVKHEGLMDGVPCYPTVRDLPEVPDCVVLAVGAELLPKALEECADRGVGGAIIYASGFAEIGTTAGRSAQDRIAAIGCAGGMRIVVPNCLGLVNTKLGAGLNFVPSFSQMKLIGGPVSVVSQGGGFGYALVQGMERGVGIGHFLSPGNSADVDVCDFIAYLAEDPQVRAIACMFEGVDDGARFLQAAELARDHGKPLVVYKVGTSEVARQAALSHTGTMVGATAAFAAAFERANVIALDHMDGLLDTASFLARAGAPRAGKGVGVMATSGGAAVSMADKADEHGVLLPALSECTSTQLHAIIPGFGSIANPADLTAEVLKTKETFVGCLEAFAQEPSFDALVVPFVLAGPESTQVRAPMLAEVSRRTGLPIAGIWLTEWTSGPGAEVLDGDSHASLFRSADHCFEALSHWMRWHERKRQRTELGSPTTRLSDRSASERAQALLRRSPRGGFDLNEMTSKQILSCYGLDFPKEQLAETVEQAVAAAETIGFPVALKVVSPDIAHKTEAGGVELRLPDARAVKTAFERVMGNARQHHPDARIEGVVVQQMVSRGIEMMLGARIDPHFGPLVIAGFGGVLVEVLRDTAVRLAPVQVSEAREMLASLRGSRLLEGYRGGVKADLDTLACAIARFSEFVADNASLLQEVDVNPLVVDGANCICVDALIVRKA
jgi:acetate---CoA ligase (ADP-forming)